jgi:hypothetical protein
MNTTMLFLKISLVVKNLFDQKTSDDLRAIKAAFRDAYSDAQLCALVLVGMVIRVFGLAPKTDTGSRSIGFIVGLLIRFLQSLDAPYVDTRALNPLDEMVANGLEQVGEHG